jgi:RecJ-like exonuclease
MQSNRSFVVAGSTKLPPEMAPGDEARSGTPGAGENVCRMCDGTGQVDGHTCPDCEGSGKVIEGVGGA